MIEFQYFRFETLTFGDHKFIWNVLVNKFEARESLRKTMTLEERNVAATLS